MVIPVIIKPTELSDRYRLEGNVLMRLRKKDIGFLHPQTYKDICVIPLSWVRRFGRQPKDNIFFTEVGRKCPKGEGMIYCFTEKSRELHMFLNDASKK